MPQQSARIIKKLKGSQFLYESDLGLKQDTSSSRSDIRPSSGAGPSPRSRPCHASPLESQLNWDSSSASSV